MQNFIHFCHKNSLAHHAHHAAHGITSAAAAASPFHHHHHHEYNMEGEGSADPLGEAFQSASAVREKFQQKN